MPFVVAEVDKDCKIINYEYGHQCTYVQCTYRDVVLQDFSIKTYNSKLQINEVGRKRIIVLRYSCLIIIL